MIGGTGGVPGGGFLYTCLDTVSVGVVVGLDGLAAAKTRPEELIGSLKAHPAIAPYLRGAELKEYSAHLIPEGGYRAMPKLAIDGMLVAGDAAFMCLAAGLWLEGVNFAIFSEHADSVELCIFDDEGRQFDAQGNLRDWWTEKDGKEFETRASCVANEYGNFVAVDDLKLNGRLTLGENTADNGGARVSLAALEQMIAQDKTGKAAEPPKPAAPPCPSSAMATISSSSIRCCIISMIPRAPRLIWIVMPPMLCPTRTTGSRDAACASSGTMRTRTRRDRRPADWRARSAQRTSGTDPHTPPPPLAACR